jgi:hypothetical protein
VNGGKKQVDYQGRYIKTVAENILSIIYHDKGEHGEKFGDISYCNR